VVFETTPLAWHPNALAIAPWDSSVEVW